MPVANSVAVATGSTAVACHQTTFVAAEGDLFSLAGLSVPIAASSPGQLTLKYPWPGPTLSDQTAFAVTPTGPGWKSVITLNQRLVEIITRLDDGFPFHPKASGTLAQRSQYDGERQGFTYLRSDVTPPVLFIKTADTSGAWSAGSPMVGTPGAPGLPGPGTEWRVNTSTFAIEYRTAGSANAWTPAPGGDLDDIVGPYRAQAQASAAAALDALQGAEAATAAIPTLMAQAQAALQAAVDEGEDYRDEAAAQALAAQGHAGDAGAHRTVAEAMSISAAGHKAGAQQAATDAQGYASTIQNLLNIPVDMGDQSEPAGPSYDMGEQGT